MEQVAQVYGTRTPDGVQSLLRLGRDLDLIVSNLHARFYEQNVRGNIFSLDSDSVTLASANATKSALGTAKFINGLFNPSTSGKNIVLLSAKVATVSGTPGGPYFYNYFVDSTISSAATGTIRPAILGASLTSVARALVNVAVANTAGATTALTQLGVMGGPAAIAAGAGLYDAVDEVEGRIIIPPGVAFGLSCLAAGTSHVVQSTLVWEEVPIQTT